MAGECRQYNGLVPTDEMSGLQSLLTMAGCGMRKCIQLLIDDSNRLWKDRKSSLKVSSWRNTGSRGNAICDLKIYNTTYTCIKHHRIPHGRNFNFYERDKLG